jgi:pimeloyl-ACP methyl ester carboxylesterase
MKESLVQFGENGRLVGTLLEASTMDDGRSNAPPRVAVLTFNAGLIPRTGPHRLWVKLARRLGREGLSSFRFDLNGQGDSAQVPSTMAFEAQAAQDIVSAMDAVFAQTGIERFVLAGICSGAALSYKAALIDRRVVGCAMIDIYMYPTWRTRWVLLQHRIPQEGLPAILARWGMQRLRFLKNFVTNSPAAKRAPSALPGLNRPSPDEFAAGLQTLLNRQTKLLLVYTGSFLYNYNYKNQFRDRFKAYKISGPLRVDFDPQIDHTVTELSAQEFVLEKLGRWIQDIEVQQRRVEETQDEPDRLSASLTRPLILSR